MGRGRDLDGCAQGTHSYEESRERGELGEGERTVGIMDVIVMSCIGRYGAVDTCEGPGDFVGM